MATDRLSTVYLYSQFTGTPVADLNAARVNAALDAASQAIANACGGRLFEVTTYRQWLDGYGDELLYLPHWPIVRLYGCSTYAQDAIEVKFTGTGQHAQIMTEAAQVVLLSVASGVETETELTYAAYPTLGTLATAIAAVTGWTATVASGLSNYPSAWIRNGVSLFCLSPDTADLEIPDETNEAQAVAESDRAVRRLGGIGWPDGRSNVYAHWKAGYTLPVDGNGHESLTTAGTVPEDLQAVCNMIAKGLLDAASQNQGGLQSESIGGDYSYSISEGGRGVLAKLCAEHAGTLAAYKGGA